LIAWIAAAAIAVVVAGHGFSHQEHRELIIVTFLFLNVLSIERRLRSLSPGNTSTQPSR